MQQGLFGGVEDAPPKSKRKQKSKPKPKTEYHQLGPCVMCGREVKSLIPIDTEYPFFEGHPTSCFGCAIDYRDGKTGRMTP